MNLFGGLRCALSRHARRRWRRSDKLRRLAPLLPARGCGIRGASRWQRLGARAHHTRASEAVSLRIEGLPGDVRHAARPHIRINSGGCASGTTRDRGDPVSPAARYALSGLLVLDLDWQLAESLLQKADKMSMAASIELRTPLLDLRVAANSPRAWLPSLKLPPGGPGKLVLRHCLARKLHEPLDRPKARLSRAAPRRGLRGRCASRLEVRASSRADSACLAHLDRKHCSRAAWDGFPLAARMGRRAHDLRALAL